MKIEISLENWGDEDKDLLNKQCKYMVNELLAGGGFRCSILDEHLEQSGILFKNYCSRCGKYKNCPYYID